MHTPSGENDRFNVIIGNKTPQSMEGRNEWKVLKI
jgi:hypothetical protein